MASTRKPRAKKSRLPWETGHAVEKFVAEIRRDLRRLGAKEGYILMAKLGPYDHNPHDVPLPSPEYPRVFRALYEAVDYAQTMKEWGKVKIERVDGSVVPGSHTLASTVVWRSWRPGEHGGWTDNRTVGSVRAKDRADLRFARHELQDARRAVRRVERRHGRAGGVAKTVTVTRLGKQKKDAFTQRFTSTFSPLPGYRFGPFVFREMARDLTVSALLSPVAARNLLLDAFAHGQATAPMG